MENNSILLTSANITDSENHELDSLEFVVEGILIPVLTFLGLVGNILSITVLHSPGVDMKVINTVGIRMQTDRTIYIHPHGNLEYREQTFIVSVSIVEECNLKIYVMPRLICKKKLLHMFPVHT